MKSRPKTSEPAATAREKAGVSPARGAAFRVLLHLEDGKSHADDLLRGKRIDALAPVDRHLATALVLGVLRWQIQLDAQIRPLLARPDAKLDTEVRIALRLGAFQILHMDRIPARAAIDESVELTKLAGHKFAASMVNAVLRKLAAAPRDVVEEVSVAGIACADAHPQWMVERWAEFYGLDAARAICQFGQSQPRLSVRGGEGVEADLAKDGIELAPGQMLNASRMVASGDVVATEAFRTGQIRVQDEGSQLVAEIAASLLADQAGRVLDACAAPGGKSLILAERNPEATIVACEVSAQRFESMRKRLAQSERIECRLADATQLDEDAVYDVVLVDAPCSGTGTLGRNPEIRHRLSIEDLERQAERQRAILKGALRAVKTGGFIVYSTCSLEPEENERVVAAVLSEDHSSRVVAISSVLEGMEARSILKSGTAKQLENSITPEASLRLLPGKFETDGFFIVVLERSR